MTRIAPTWLVTLLGLVLAGVVTSATERREARLRVTWPDGEQGAWHDVRADQAVILRRDAPTARQPA